MEIVTKCIDQNIAFVNTPEIFSGTKNTVTMKFEFSDIWNSYGKTAVFYKDLAKPVFVALSLDNTCVVPQSVLAEEGTMYVGVIGATTDKIITSEIVPYDIGVGATTMDAVEEPEPEIWEQILTEVGKAQEIMSEFEKNYVPITRTINSKSLDNNISLTADDVGALTLSDIQPWKNNKTETRDGWILTFRKVGWKQAEIKVDKVFSEGQPDRNLNDMVTWLPLLVDQPQYFHVSMMVAGGCVNTGIGMIDTEKRFYLGTPEYGNAVEYIGTGIISLAEDLGDE